MARQLGRKGCLALVAARNKNLGEEAVSKLQSEHIEARSVEIDLRRKETIAAASALVEVDFGSRDILVNNAGIADSADGPPSTAKLDTLERLLEINFLGAVAVTQAMLPSLRQAEAARIVNVSSGVGSVTLHSDPNWEFASVKLFGYCASKAALGLTATDLNDQRGYQTVEQGAADAIRLALLGESGPSGGFFAGQDLNPREGERTSSRSTVVLSLADISEKHLLISIIRDIIQRNVPHVLLGLRLHVYLSFSITNSGRSRFRAGRNNFSQR